MLRLLYMFLLLPVVTLAQPSLELEPSGFAPATVSIPTTPNDKLIELTKSWAQEYNKNNKRGYDITDVTDNSVTITSYKKNAFYYRNKGESFNHSIGYTMKLNFGEGTYTVTFSVDDIYFDNDKLLEYKIPDYFTDVGKLKEGYTGLDTSLEKNVNEIVLSHYNFLLNFR